MPKDLRTKKLTGSSIKFMLKAHEQMALFAPLELRMDARGPSSR